MSKYHALIYRNLASLNESGVDLRKSLKISNCGPNTYQKAMELAAETVNKGGTIAEGLRLSPKLFRKNDVDIIAAAENTGSLPFALRMLAAEHEARRKLIFDALGRFTYTLIIFHAAALILNIVYNVLNYGFDFSGYPLRLLLTLSILYIPLLSIYLIVTKTPSSGPLRYIVDLIAYTIPGLGGAIKAISLGRFARVCNLTYRAGMPEDQAIKIASEVTGNIIVSRMFEKCIDSVKKGNPVSEGFSRLLPKQFTETWKVGEIAGTHEATTAKLADIYEEEGLFRIRAFCSSINFIFYLLIIITVAIGIIIMASRIFSQAYNI